MCIYTCVHGYIHMDIHCIVISLKRTSSLWGLRKVLPRRQSVTWRINRNLPGMKEEETIVGERKLSNTPLRSSSCHQQFSCKWPHIFHLTNLCKLIYCGKELQPPVGLIRLANCVSKPAAELETRKRGCSQCWITWGRTSGYDQKDTEGTWKIRITLTDLVTFAS